MFILRVATTVLIMLFMLIIGWFLLSTKVSDKASVVGFSAMEITYIMALICVWG